MKMLGLILVIVGVIALLVPSITFFTRERAVDGGFFAIDVSRPHTIVMNPAVGALAMIAGILMLVLSPRTAV